MNQPQDRRRGRDRRQRGQLGPSCPYCTSNASMVIDSRWHVLTSTKRRTRHCSSCGEKFYTEEKALKVRIERSA